MIINGIEYKEYWKDGRDVCKELKKNNLDAVEIMARFFFEQNIFDEKSILIPAPQHTGKAIYTLEVAKIISQNTGARIADILRCSPRETLYSQKLHKGILHTDLFLSAPVPDGKIFFIDNCIASGRTFFDSEKLIGKMIPIAYGMSKRL